MRDSNRNVRNEQRNGNESSRAGLYALALHRGLRIGTCISVPPLLGDQRYAETVIREFNLITPENALKFGIIAPARGTYDFAEADTIVEFAEAHRMEVRGHVLVWDLQLPHWLKKKNFRPSEMREILESHIATVVGRYAGRITIWDVCNEAIGDSGAMRQTIWHNTVGPDYVKIAFRAARAADPRGSLFYNDRGIEATAEHFEGVCRLLDELRQSGCPVDGIGLQMHLDLNQADKLQHLPARLDRLAEFGLRVHVTELDVRMKLQGEPTPGQLASQADVYRRVLRSCLHARSCDVLAMWGFTDRHSWVPHFFPDYGAALIFDEEYEEKPGYREMAAELRSFAVS